MDPLLTPMTALFYSSILEPSMFDAPTTSSNPAAVEADIFGHAFGAHDFSKANREAAEKFNALDLSSKHNGAEAATFYFSSPGSSNQSAFGQESRDPSAEEEPMQFYDFPPQAMQHSMHAGSGEQSAGVPEYYNAGQTQYNAASMPPVPEKKTRKRKRRQLSEEEKAAKHAAFLERNRVAADKCRKRKKANNLGLEEECKVLRLRNSVLRDIREDLMAEVQGLRNRVDIGTEEVREEKTPVTNVQEQDEATLQEENDEVE